MRTAISKEKSIICTHNCFKNIFLFLKYKNSHLTQVSYIVPNFCYVAFNNCVNVFFLLRKKGMLVDICPRIEIRSCLSLTWKFTFLLFPFHTVLRFSLRKISSARQRKGMNGFLSVGKHPPILFFAKQKANKFLHAVLNLFYKKVGDYIRNLG